MRSESLTLEVWTVAVIGTGLLVVVACLSLAALVLLRLQEQYVKAEYDGIWPPLFKQIIAKGLPKRLPVLKRAHRRHFLATWVYWAHHLPEGPSEALLFLAREVNLYSYVRWARWSPYFHVRVHALKAGGLLFRRRYRPTLLRLLRSRHPLVSAMAARTLQQAHGHAVDSEVGNALLERNDWKATQMHAMVKALAPAVRESLWHRLLLLEADAELPARLATVLLQVDPMLSLTVLGHPEARRFHEEILGLCLQAVPREAVAHAVRLTLHGSALVRMEALAAVLLHEARLGEAALARLAEDSQPSVREFVARLRAYGPVRLANSPSTGPSHADVLAAV